MAELCWFCKKASAYQGETFEVPFFKVTAKRTKVTYLEGGSMSRTGYRYLTANILIPRCSQCAQAHARVNRVERFKWVIGGIGIALIFGLWFTLNSVYRDFNSAISYSGPALIVIWIIAFNLAIQHYRRSQITRPSDIFKHPEVDRMLKEGYAVGYSPTSPLKIK